MLEKKIEELKPYFDGWFVQNSGENGIRVILPEAWVVYGKKTDSYTIKPRKDYDNNKIKYMFIGDSNAKVIDIVDFVIEVVQNNLDNEAKKALFSEKVNELASVFDSNKLSLLKTITFKFNKPKKEKKIKSDVITPEAIAEKIIDRQKDAEIITNKSEE